MLAYDQKYILFDTETEGLNLGYSRPWELSYLEGQGRKVVKSKQIYIDIPDLELSQTVIRLTNFSWERYNDTKVSPEEAWEEFAPLLFNEEYKVVGQNIIKYDSWILNVLAGMIGAEYNFEWLERALDTRLLGVAIKNDIEKPRNGSMLNWQLKLYNDKTLKHKGTAQEAMLKLFGIDYDKYKLHDGLYDCQMSWKIFVEQVKTLKL